MPVLPNSRADMIQWFSDRIADWAANAADIGLAPAQVAELATKLSNSQTAFDEANAARIASKDATLVYHLNADDLRSYGADLIKLIKAYADTTDNPVVFATASVPPPAAPSPLGPPATPTDLNASLTSAGEIALTWKGSRTGGTTFIVERSVASAGGPWTIVGASESQDYIDVSVPTGNAAIFYRITALRSGGSSTPTPAYPVLFGNTSQNSQSQTGGGNTGLSLAA